MVGQSEDGEGTLKKEDLVSYLLLPVFKFLEDVKFTRLYVSKFKAFFYRHVRNPPPRLRNNCPQVLFCTQEQAVFNSCMPDRGRSVRQEHG